MLRGWYRTKQRTFTHLRLARHSDHERRAVVALLWNGERTDAEAVFAHAHGRRDDATAAVPTRLSAVLL